MISVVIPMYNVEHYLETCVFSVINQKSDFGIEMVIVDDGSTDDSLAAAKKWAVLHSSIKILTQKNKGLGGARNTGILNARGKYVLFLDADDRLAENSLAKLFQIAEEHQVDVLEFAAKGIDDEGNVVYDFSKKLQRPLNGRAYYNTLRYMNSACNKLYHLDFLKQNDLYFRERIFLEDFEFNTRVFAKAERVLATDVNGAYFLQTPQSITRNTDVSKINKMQRDIIEVLQITSDLYQLQNEKETVLFFRERLGYLTATLFYQLFKRKAPYYEIRELKKILISEKIFFPNFPIYERKKEFFRLLVVKNLYLYPLLIRLIR